MFKIVVHKRAAGYLRRLPSEHKERIRDAIKTLAATPNEQLHVKQMVGDWKGYSRLRISKFRVIFWIDSNKNILYVDHIGTRGDIYKS